MTSFQSNDRNNLEEQGINIKIQGVELIILPIPENRLNVNNFLAININIINSKITPFRFNRSGTFIPQFVSFDGQALQIQQSRDRRKSNKYDDYIFNYGESSFVSLYAKLFWKNNKLQLQISDLPTDEGYYWTVDDIKPGTYQLQFIYRTNITTSAGVETVRLDTQFITLRLIETVKANKNAVEVDGIQFETFMPKQILTIPKKHPDATTPVQFGLRITNLSSTSYRFKFHGLMPQFQNIDGQLIRLAYNRNVTIPIEESHFLLAISGETLTSFVNGELYWYGDELVMRGSESMGGFWFFHNLKEETYRVHFTYTGLTQSTVARFLRGVVIENLWTGIVPTPFIEFRLVK
ncbi:MAG: hypothetical protein IGS49_21000 [Chlorogloeopsis fritschii C42_A2020_084]|uniref:hypothetical protein n=1 Tax=Chlorogloeopsis fritschii TaxID=1124 RepID=UPI0019E015D8|nr:hypothetical protein [Chlorogloeopsis fritschii]MBF2007856.1 hypothetical protein [Chlorogloeopsis fritschii C42_A2020_084]